MYDIHGLNEECGVFGVFNHPQASELTYMALHSLQHRGQEGAGIVCSNGEYLFGARGMGLLTEALSQEQLMSLETFPHAIGHVRYATTGGSEISNVQPFLFKSHKGDLGLAHNGNLVNAISVREALEDDGAIFQTSSDSEVLAHLIRKNKSPDRKQRIKTALRQLKGAFAFVILDEDSLTIALDDHGVRPLMLGMVDGAYCVASETCAFTAIGAEYIRDIEPGELITLSDKGIEFDYYTDTRHPNMCSMEYIYFARADSEFRNTSTYTIRKSLGRELAREMDVSADIVIGVPDSSLAAAKGFSEASGIPQEQGLLKNRYVGPDVHFKRAGSPRTGGTHEALPGTGRRRGQERHRHRRLHRTGNDKPVHRQGTEEGGSKGSAHGCLLPAAQESMLLWHRCIDACRNHRITEINRGDPGRDRCRFSDIPVGRCDA